MGELKRSTTKCLDLHSLNMLSCVISISHLPSKMRTIMHHQHTLWEIHTLMRLCSLPPQIPAIWSSPVLHTTRGHAPLALNCCATLCIFLHVLSWVASTMMGMCSSTNARGPCFISPARMPSLCMYTSSFTCGIQHKSVPKDWTFCWVLGSG